MQRRRKSKPTEKNLEREYRTVLAYYHKTAWPHVRNRRLSGAEFLVVWLAWERLERAQQAWSDAFSTPPSVCSTDT